MKIYIILSKKNWFLYVYILLFKNYSEYFWFKVFIMQNNNNVSGYKLKYKIYLYIFYL